MSDANTRETEFLIIRRSGSNEAEAHKGGVWKIAYADFMTAMMAFFLVMWLINATSETTKTGVANYFNPIKLSDGMQLPKKGLSDPENVEVVNSEADEAEAAEASAEHAEAAEEAAAAKHETSETAPEAAAAEADTAAEKKARFTEDALFRDPYAVLAAIAAQAEGSSSLDGTRGGPGAGGADAVRESYGDPFDPSAWDAAGLATAGRSDQSPSATGVVAAAAPLPSPLPSAETLLPEATFDESAAARATTDRTEDGAGNAGEAAAGAQRLKQELLQTIEQAVASGSMPNITVENADGGVLISLADKVNFGMFAIGSAEPLPETIAIMEKIAALLQDMPGRVIIRGHTDGRPFRSENYDNWRLSAARAHMAYHMLVRGGLDERRVERIEGYADRDLKLPEAPDAAENRRIDILVQHEEARS